MHVSQFNKINNWYIVNLTVPTLIGEVKYKREIKVELLGIEWTTLTAITPNKLYKLGNADKVWTELKSSEETLRNIPILTLENLV